MIFFGGVMNQKATLPTLERLANTPKRSADHVQKRRVSQMSDFIKELPKVSMEKPNGKIKKVVLDLQRGDTMHVTFKIGNKVLLKVEAVPGNMLIERDIYQGLKREINFYTKTLSK